MSLFVICLILVLIGPGSLTFGLYRLYVETRPRRWATVPGVITQSKVSLQYVDPGSSLTVPIIEFKYHYGNHTGHSTAHIFTIGTPESAASTVARYPLGSSVSVKVNPKNPLQACLESSITPSTWFFLIAGCLCLAVEIATFRTLVATLRY